MTTTNTNTNTGSSFDFVFSSFTQNQDLTKYSSSQLKTLAENIDKLTPNNTVSVDAIYDQLLSYQQSSGSSTLNTTMLLQFLSMENPTLPPPNTTDPTQANMEFQQWLQSNTALIPNGGGITASDGAQMTTAESLAFLMSSITFTNNMSLQTAQAQSTGVWNTPTSVSVQGSVGDNIAKLLSSGLSASKGAAGLDGIIGSGAFSELVSMFGSGASGLASLLSSDVGDLSKTSSGQVLNLGSGNEIVFNSAGGMTLIYGSANQYVAGSGGDTISANMGNTGLTLEDDASTIMSNAYALPGQTLPTSSDGALNDAFLFSETMAIQDSNGVYPGVLSSTAATGTAGVTGAAYDSTLTQTLVGNTNDMIDQASSAVQDLLNSIPPNPNSNEAAAAAVLGQILQALASMKNFLSELEAGNAKVSNADAQMQLGQNMQSINDQNKIRDDASHQSKKQKILSIFMKVITPILMVAAAVATVLTGGLSGPLLALTVALFVISVADQITAQVTGQGMFSQMFSAISAHLPPGAAMAVKCIMLVCVCIAAVFCPANAAMCAGLAAQIVQESGIQTDAVTIAKDHGMSSKGQNILNWTLTGSIAAGAIIGTAGAGIYTAVKSTSTEALDDVADGSSSLMKSKVPADPNVATASNTPTQAADQSGGVWSTVKGAVVSSFTAKSTGLETNSIAAGVGVGMNVGASAVGAAGGIATGVSDLEMANFEKQQAAIQAQITDIQAEIQALEKIIKQFTDGNANISDWSNSVSAQIGTMMKGWGASMTGLANAG